MNQIKQKLLQTLGIAMTLCFVSVAIGQDTDGDGLLDLIDVPGFDPNVSGTVFFDNLGIEDLDGANLLTQVHDLLLYNNQITSIENGDFGGLNNLRQLALHNNQITSLESGDFDGLNDLGSLELSGNQITSLESGGFDGLANLQVLWLNNNSITSLESGAFDGLTNLQFLLLEGNQITSIENGTFDGLANLRNLFLYENQITSLESGDFGGLNDLHELRLEKNDISRLNLTRATFDNMGRCSHIRGLCVDSKEITALVLDDATLSQGSFDGVVGETTHIVDVSLVGLAFSDESPTDLSVLLGIETLNNVTVDQALFGQYADEFNAFAGGDGNTLTVIGYGDANLDGEFNSSDMVAVFTIGKYESQDAAVWAEGDWNGDGVFSSSDMVRAFTDGGYELGPRPAFSVVPEPGSLALLMLGLIGIAIRRRP